MPTGIRSALGDVMAWLWLGLATGAVAGGLHARCQEGETRACERLLGDVGQGMARAWADGEEVRAFRRREFAMLTLQTALLRGRDAGGPLPSSAEFECRRLPIPACPAKAPAPPRPAPTEPAPLARHPVQGRVVAEDGRPVAGAVVRLRRNWRQRGSAEPGWPTAMQRRLKVVGLTQTDAEGRFAFASVAAAEHAIDAAAEGLRGWSRDFEPAPGVEITVEARPHSTQRVEVQGAGRAWLVYDAWILPTGTDGVAHVSRKDPPFSAVMAESGFLDDPPGASPIELTPWNAPTCRVLRQGGSPHPRQPEPFPCLSPPADIEGGWLMRLDWRQRPGTSDIDIVERNTVRFPHATSVTLRQGDTVIEGKSFFERLPAGRYEVEVVTEKMLWPERDQSERITGWVTLEDAHGQRAEVEVEHRESPDTRAVRVVDDQGIPVALPWVAYQDPFTGRVGQHYGNVEGVFDFPVDETGTIRAIVENDRDVLPKAIHAPLAMNLPALPSRRAVKKAQLDGVWTNAREETLTFTADTFNEDPAQIVKVAPGVFGVRVGREPFSVVFADRNTVAVFRSWQDEVQVYPPCVAGGAFVGATRFPRPCLRRVRRGWARPWSAFDLG